jgi:hypothetical protein
MKIHKQDVAQKFGMAPIQFSHYLQGIKREFKVAPPTALVLKYLASTDAALAPLPSAIAKKISEQNNYPLKIGDKSNEPTLKVSKSRLARAQTKFEKNALLRNLPPVSNSRQQGVVSHDKFDNERVSEINLVHCPHGVPKIQVCAICDPERFREINGVD